MTTIDVDKVEFNSFVPVFKNLLKAFIKMVSTLFVSNLGARECLKQGYEGKNVSYN